LVGHAGYAEAGKLLCSGERDLLFLSVASGAAILSKTLDGQIAAITFDADSLSLLWLGVEVAPSDPG